MTVFVFLSGVSCWSPCISSDCQSLVLIIFAYVCTSIDSIFCQENPYIVPFGHYMAWLLLCYALSLLRLAPQCLVPIYYTMHFQRLTAELYVCVLRLWHTHVVAQILIIINNGKNPPHMYKVAVRYRCWQFGVKLCIHNSGSAHHSHTNYLKVSPVLHVTQGTKAHLAIVQTFL